MALEKVRQWLSRAKPEPVIEAAPEATPAAEPIIVPAWTDPVPLREDGAVDTDPIVYVRDGVGTLTRCYAKTDKAFSFPMDGSQCAHVATAPDGTWIYEARRA